MEALSKDEALKSELEALVKNGAEKDAKTLINFAASKGFTLTEEDFEQKNEELSLEELKAVAGGGRIAVTMVCGDTAWGVLCLGFALLS